MKRDWKKTLVPNKAARLFCKMQKSEITVIEYRQLIATSQLARQYAKNQN